MRLQTLCLVAASLAAAPAAGAAAPDPPPPFPAAMDTTVRVRFNLPARPLTEALAEFSRQATIHVRVDLPAAGSLRSRAVAGVRTPPEALRELLAGTGMVVRFADGETALVSPSASSGLLAYTLTPLTVIGTRSRGYAATRTTTATRTDTPLRDTPQSVSVVTRELIADQAMQGMADVVRYVPGVTMGQGEGHRDAPTIRGNSSTADFFVDGVRDDAQYLRDLYNSERVEALKGANAMVFGRGGGGGVLNRVTKEAQWVPARSVTLTGGSFDHRRGVLDVGQGLGPAIAGRLNAVYEESGGFRQEYGLRRVGVNPTLALALGGRTTVRAGYEFFDDERTVDRGIPSFEGRPSDADITTFFGNPDVSRSAVEVHAATASVEHVLAGGLTVRNRSRFADYGKFYQNSYPGGAVSLAGTQVNLSAYNQTLGRRNFFNQTDATYTARAGGMSHTLLVGAEVGRQESDTYRRTGYYNGSATSLAVPFAAPTVATPIEFRQSASDADNATTATVAGVYLQDQVALSRHLQAIVGVRYDRFDVDFVDHRNGEALSRDDRLFSPRAGLVLKPAEPVSIYGSYSVSFLPSSGDQFASLSATAETLEPERFDSYEVGAKWDVRPSLSLTGAAYRLDRTNTRATDPADPSRTVQTGAQRTTGFELGATGSILPAWQVTGGFARQRAEVVSATSSAEEGATVPLVPARTLSLWNRWQVAAPLGVGLGVVHQSDMYAAIDNSVTLPGFTRADGAVFLRLNRSLDAQVNVENLFDERYYATSHGNNNIMPGASRTLRFSLTARP